MLWLVVVLVRNVTEAAVGQQRNVIAECFGGGEVDGVVRVVGVGLRVEVDT